MDVCISCIIICNYKLILVISYYFRTLLDKYYTNLCKNIFRKNETLQNEKNSMDSKFVLLLICKNCNSTFLTRKLRKRLTTHASE